jgi:L-fuconate dehydratase
MLNINEQMSFSLIDYIAVSGSMERNVLEFVDHLHEHFVTPCSINSNGRYNVPMNPDEGYRYVEHSTPIPSASDLQFLSLRRVLSALFYRSQLPYSIEMHKSSIAEFEWPNGSYWVGAKANK